MIDSLISSRQRLTDVNIYCKVKIKSKVLIQIINDRPHKKIIKCLFTVFTNVINLLTWNKWLSSIGRVFSLFPRNWRCKTQSSFPMIFGTLSNFLLHRFKAFGLPLRARTSIVSAILTLFCCYTTYRYMNYDDLNNQCLLW